MASDVSHTFKLQAVTSVCIIHESKWTLEHFMFSSFSFVWELEIIVESDTTTEYTTLLVSVYGILMEMFGQMKGLV